MKASKSCVVCGRTIEWRRKWADSWDEIRRCSARCRRRRLSSFDHALEDETVRLLGSRPSSATICPSEVVRSLRPESWRPHMERTREAARRLAAWGVVEFRQKGRTVDPSTAKGAVRLARGPDFETSDQAADADPE